MNAKPWSLDRLAGLSQVQLETLYQNAVNHGSDEANDIIELILQHELLEKVGGGLKRYHPIVQRIESICRSPEGIAAGIAAAHQGQAPMAGVDILLQEGVGPNYGNYDTTSWVGGFVAEEMEAEGWLRQGRKALPPECVAKTAAFLVLRSQG